MPLQFTFDATDVGEQNAAARPALFDGLGDLDDAAPAARPVLPATPVAAGYADTDDSLDAPAAAPKRSRRTTAGAGGAPARRAVTDALALLASLGAPVAAPGAPAGPTPAMVPTARVRPALDTLAGAGNIEALNDARVNLKQLVRDACNWDAAAGNRGTGAVVKALGRAVTGTDEKGRSTYPQAVEMISFASVCAPLLESDRLVRLIDEASTTPSAFAPMRYTATLIAQLQILLSAYQPQRREQLLVSLWQTAHQGRWWDTVEVDAPNAGAPRRRRRRVDAEEQELREAHEAELQNLFGRPGTVPADLVAQALQSRALAFSQPALRRMASVAGTAEELSALGQAARKLSDPDADILIAHVPGIPPDLRPESPIPTMVANLVAALSEIGDDEPDEDDDERVERLTGANGIAAHLPAKAKAWGELYPRASGNRFPYTRAIRALHGITLPGTGGPGQPAEAVIELLRTPHALQLNGQEMGNCTFVYRAHCERGEMAIGRIYQSGHTYNFSIVPGNGHWTLREINSRANLGNVPTELRAGIVALAAAIPR